MLTSSDKGLQYERTHLSWRRTFLSLMVFTSYLMKLLLAAYVNTYVLLFIAMILIISALSNDLINYQTIVGRSNYVRFHLMCGLVLTIAAAVLFKISTNLFA